MHKLNYPHYFSHKIKREVMELYASSTIANLAISMVMLFEPIYFVTVLGWSVSNVLMFFLAVYVIYLFIMPLGAKVAARYGYEHSMLFSIPFQIGYWLLIFGASEYQWTVFLAIIFFAIQKSLYWPAFHGDLARFSDSDQRAREFSGMFAIMQGAYIIGPFLGGMISESFGIRALLIISSAIYFTMFIPMFTTNEKTRNIKYRYRDTFYFFKNKPKDFIAYVGFGEELLILVVWPLFIFTLVPSFFNIGVIISVATLIASLVMLFAGKISDTKDRSWVLRGGVLGSVLIWIGRVFVSTTIGVFLADSLSKIFRDLFYVPVVSSAYDVASHKKSNLDYIVFFEQSLVIGKILACLLGALIFMITESFAPLFLLAGLFTLLYTITPNTKKVVI